MTTLDFILQFVVRTNLFLTRHWLVLLSGTTMVLIFWAITPLQSAQIGTGSVNHSSYLGIVNRSELVPVAQQEDLLGPEVLYSMYPISWLDQPYPEFMLESTAFLPFYSEKTTNLTTIKGTNLTAATTQLSTELACWAAEASVHEGSLGMGSTTFDISSGRGCKTNMAIPVAEGYSMFYVGYHDSPYSDFWLGTAKDCPKTPENEHLFLATWSEATGNLSAKDASYNVNLTGSFCQPSYFKQNVLVTIDAATRRPYGDSVTPLASREALTDSEFNRTAFEFLLANGMSEIMKERDHPFNSVLEQHPKLRGRDLRMPVSNMVGFALAGQDRNTTDYYDREILHAAYNRAHQHIFSVAVSQLLTNTSNFDNSTATGVYPMSGIVVSRPISAALEALLLLVAIFTAIIMWISRSAVSHMHANPSSIDRVADIVRESPQLSDVFCNVSSADEDSLKSAIQDKRFRLVRDDLTAPPKIVVEDCPDAEKEQDNERPKGYYIPVKPLFLRVEIGIAFIVAVAGVLGGLGYLKWAEVQFKGLAAPVHQSCGLQ